MFSIYSGKLGYMLALVKIQQSFVESTSERTVLFAQVGEHHAHKQKHIGKKHKKVDRPTVSSSGHESPPAHP